MTVGSGTATGRGVKRKGQEVWMKSSLKKAVKGDETVNNIRDKRKKKWEYNEVKFGRHKKME